MFSTLLYFVFALILLVLVHEFGHYSVARVCHVKVLRFSFGFGKVLASWTNKHGTEFSWSLIPLGGYVKMLDETEGEVLPSERHLAFNRQSVWKRIAIVAAGPAFNLMFAFFATWLILVIGMQSLAPMIGAIKPGSIAARAGLEINQEIRILNEKKIHSWTQFHYAMMPLLGSDAPIRLTVESLDSHQQQTLSLSLMGWTLDPQKQDLLDSLGITPYIPKIPPIVGEVLPNSSAQVAGILAHDEIVQLNEKPISDWLTIVQYVKQHPNQTMTLTVKRQGQLRTFTVPIKVLPNDAKKTGFIGLRSQPAHWPKGWLRTDKEAPIPAIKMAFFQTTELTGATFSLIGRLITGKLPWNSISGPLGIAEGAGESGRNGFVYYLSFLALVSISLGVLNLLPIPILDGGHLLYCLIEVVFRRPLSERVRILGMYLGIFLLAALMVVALKNDLTRLWSTFGS